METNPKTTALRQLIDQLPAYLPMEDEDDSDALILQLEKRIAAYHFQNMALYFRKFVHGLPSPGFGFEISIDEEDETWFLYTGGDDGVLVDEGSFPDEDAFYAFRAEQNTELEGFAQGLNDGSWRTMSDFKSLIEALNEIEWRKEDLDETIRETMNNQGYDGNGFMSSLQAHQIDQGTVQSPAQTSRRPGL